MSRLLAAAVLLPVLASQALAGGLDCRMKYLPPPSFASGLVEVGRVALPLARLQEMHAGLTGKVFRGVDECGTLGFFDPRGPTVYYASDVSDRCAAETILHEEAHARGWPADHPGATIQKGPCSR